MKFNKNSLQGLKNTTPKVIQVNEIPEVPISFLELNNGRLSMFRTAETLNLMEWIKRNKSLVDETFNRHGAMLFRGFSVGEDHQFYEVMSHLANDLLDYSEPSTPRIKVSQKIYTSTEYPKEQFIPMHNEHSYSNYWPQKICFYCSKPAAVGGETPISDSRRVFEKIDHVIKEEFTRKGVMYVRNFYDDMDLPWQHVFKTNDKRELERYCLKKGISVEWKADGNLRTKQISQAVLAHPRTNEWLWFNQAHLFHSSNLEREVREYLVSHCGEDHLPRNAFFGDGTAIPMAYLEEIRLAYEQTKLVFDWCGSDVLMLDNMLYSHGRNPFEGERRILVAMAEAFHYEHPIPVKTETMESTSHKAVSQARHNAAKFFINKSANDTDQDLKYKLAAAYRIMVSEGIDEGGISGHITMRIPNQPELFWVNPFGLLAEEVTPGNLLKVNKKGEVVEGDYPVNVAGFCIHAAIHEAYPDVNCVAHTHSPWGTLFSALNRKIEPIDQNCCLFFENHTIYEQYNGPVNDPDDAFLLAKSLKGVDVAILKNHGTITCGQTIESSIMRMVAIERAYRLNILSLQTPNVELIPAEIARMTRQWIGNDLGFSIEFNALLRKVERIYPEFKKFKP